MPDAEPFNKKYPYSGSELKIKQNSLLFHTFRLYNQK